MHYYTIFLGSTDDEAGQNGLGHLYLGSVEIVKGSVSCHFKSLFIYILKYGTQLQQLLALDELFLIIFQLFYLLF